MKTLKHYFQRAFTEKFAIGQFNFSDWSQVKGIVAAAQNLKSPIILGTSEGESKFVGLQEAVAMRNILRKKTGLPIFLNLDHAKNIDYIKEAVLAGYDMVHFDGSKLPLAENIKLSKEVVEFASFYGVLVEGEVGRFGTDTSKMYTEKFEIKEEDLTKVSEAVEYLKTAKVDLLAVSVGSFHGMDITGVSPHLKFDRLNAIRQETKLPFTLHGGSGIPEQDIKEAINMGICKININTETRLAFSKALQAELAKNEITPYKFMAAPIEAVRAVIEKNITLFGSANKT